MSKKVDELKKELDEALKEEKPELTTQVFQGSDRFVAATFKSSKIIKKEPRRVRLTPKITKNLITDFIQEGINPDLIDIEKGGDEDSG